MGWLAKYFRFGQPLVSQFFPPFRYVLPYPQQPFLHPLLRSPTLAVSRFVLKTPLRSRAGVSALGDVCEHRAEQRRGNVTTLPTQSLCRAQVARTEQVTALSGSGPTLNYVKDKAARGAGLTPNTC